MIKEHEDLAGLLGVEEGILNSGGLVIKAGGGTVPKTTNAMYYAKGGVLSVESAGDVAVLSGTILTDTFNVFVHYFDKATGTLGTTMGTAGATLGAMVFPEISTNYVVIGFTLISPTGTGSFVGGTTALDDATVVPVAVYVNMNGVVYPNMVQA